MITNAREWRKAHDEGVEIRLPSGNVMQVRSVALDVLLLQGEIPDLLSPIVAKSLWTEVPMGDIEEQTELAVGFAKLVNLVVPAATINPHVVPLGEEPTDDELTLDHLEFPDKVFIFNLAIQPVEVLYKFRDQQARTMEIIPTIGDVGDEAEPDS